VMAPTFDPEAGNPDADTPIFTWPTLAVVPDGAGGPVAATEVSSEDPSHDLALPLSVVFVPAATCYTLTVKIDNPSRGSVTVEPNLGCYAPNAPVLLTAEPLGNKQFKKWKVWDAYDPNITAIDTNNPLTIDMVADRQVKAFFKCGGGGIEEGLPLLATFGVLGLYVLARRSR